MKARHPTVAEYFEQQLGQKLQSPHLDRLTTIQPSSVPYVEAIDSAAALIETIREHWGSNRLQEDAIIRLTASAILTHFTGDNTNGDQAS